MSHDNVGRGVDPAFCTTTYELQGYDIVRYLGVVRGITVRSRSVLGNFAGALQTIFGGQISIYTSLCERTREEAFDLMRVHAAQVGANAIVAIRYDANEVMNGVTEVLAYGTAGASPVEAAALGSAAPLTWARSPATPGASRPGPARPRAGRRSSLAARRSRTRR